MKIRELLTDESKWTKGKSARNQYGLPISAKHSKACRWCLSGAVEKAYENYVDILRVESKISSNLHAKQRLSGGPRSYSIEDWNDRPNRTFEEVKALVEELDI